MLPFFLKHKDKQLVKNMFGYIEVNKVLLQF